MWQLLLYEVSANQIITHINQAEELISGMSSYLGCNAVQSSRTYVLEKCTALMFRVNPEYGGGIFF
jgi:hypothetical protein